MSQSQLLLHSVSHHVGLWTGICGSTLGKSSWLNLNWIACQPSGGSIVTTKDGSLSCQNVKNVATACSGLVPWRISWWSRGPRLYALWYYFNFDGDTGYRWPTHDPCGKNNENHKKGVSNPGGQIYLR